jgi:hypothetical protein
VSALDISPLAIRVTAIRFPQPRLVRQLRRFLGMVNYYHRFMTSAAQDQTSLTISAMLTGHKLPGSRPLKWTTETSQTFCNCKKVLSNGALLAHPHAEAPRAIVSDDSDIPMGAALQQLVNNSWQPVGFFSCKLSSTQQ